MKYLISFFLFVVAIGYSIDFVDGNIRTIRFYKNYIKENNLGTDHCPECVGPKMCQDTGKIVFVNGLPAYFETCHNLLPLLPGSVPVHAVAIYRGGEVFVDSVSLNGKAFVYYDSVIDHGHSSGWVNYADLSPYPSQN